MTASIRALAARTALAVLFLAFAGANAGAQSFVSPFVGFDFGGDANCPEITGCEDKRLNAGAVIGRMGPVLGFEMDFGYARDFFGSAPGFSSSVLTVMGNAMLVPDLGPVRPYALAGLGLIKTHVELTPESLLTTDNNALGWNVGGGAFIFFGEHVGLRGDVRYFHSFEDLSIAGLTFGDTNLDFGRASAGLVLRF